MTNDIHPDLFEWLARPYEPGEAVPWKPEPLDHEHWPPDYKAVFAWRLKQLKRMREDANFAFGAKQYYATHKTEFICHWLDTYDPRTVGPMKWKPFVLFKRQAEAIQFIEELERDQEGGLFEKCRDMGLTWLAVADTVHDWLFKPATAIGWGSRKEILVDKIGDPDSIFEKIRLQLRRLPRVFLPVGFNWKEHATFMKLINPENGAIVAGEAGDNIGRGGRKAKYYKDESAHYERPELVEAALGDNTNVPIDISSVNGIGNVFHRKRKNGIVWHPGDVIEPGKTRVFIVDWRDHPTKTQAWYDLRRAKWEADGMLHIFKQEVDRDYSGALQNTIIQAEWVYAAVDADRKIRWQEPDGTKRLGVDTSTGLWGAAMDVADGGIDRNALAKRQGIALRYIREWGDRDPGKAARWVVDDCRQHPGIMVQYDSVGIGATVKSEFNRLIEDGAIKYEDFVFVPWSAGASVLHPYDRVIPDDDESPRNRDFFANLKAQGWWSLRQRFWHTYQNVVHGVMYDPDEMISIDGSLRMVDAIVDSLTQPTIGPNGAMKQMVDKTPDGAPSPNIGDAIMMAYYPLDPFAGRAMVGNYGQAA